MKPYLKIIYLGFITINVALLFGSKNISSVSPPSHQVDNSKARNREQQTVQRAKPILGDESKRPMKDNFMESTVGMLSNWLINYGQLTSEAKSLLMLNEDQYDLVQKALDSLNQDLNFLDSRHVVLSEIGESGGVLEIESYRSEVNDAYSRFQRAMPSGLNQSIGAIIIHSHRTNGIRRGEIKRRLKYDFINENVKVEISADGKILKKYNLKQDLFKKLFGATVSARK